LVEHMLNTLIGGETHVVVGSSPARVINFFTFIVFLSWKRK